MENKKTYHVYVGDLRSPLTMQTIIENGVLSVENPNDYAFETVGDKIPLYYEGQMLKVGRESSSSRPDVSLGSTNRRISRNQGELSYKDGRIYYKNTGSMIPKANLNGFGSSLREYFLKKGNPIIMGKNKRESLIFGDLELVVEKVNDRLDNLNYGSDKY